MSLRSSSFPDRSIALPGLALALALGAAGAGAATAGCTASVPWATAASEPAASARRQPDGVVIDPVSPPPPVKDRAAASDGLVALRTPLGVDRGVATVTELFRRVVDEDYDGLEPLFTRDALAINGGSGGPGQSPSATLWWQQRFKKLDYGRLKGEQVFREAELQIFRAGDAADAQMGPSVHVEALGEGDLVIRVPILTTRAGQDRLLGDEIVLWMRREGERYRIYRMMEDFQLN